MCNKTIIGKTIWLKALTAALKKRKNSDELISILHARV